MKRKVLKKSWRMYKRLISLLSLLVISQIFYNCNTVVPTEKTIIIEDKSWNDNDSEVIADSSVIKLLLSEWKPNYKYKRKPKIVVGKMLNLTNEDIDTDFLSKNIERSFINDGNVTFISSKAKREEIRTERKNSEDFVDKKEFNKYLKNLKTDYFIDGKINVIIDSLKFPIVKKYNLSLNVTDSKNFDLVFSQKTAIVK